MELPHRVVAALAGLFLQACAPVSGAPPGPTLRATQRHQARQRLESGDRRDAAVDAEHEAVDAGSGPPAPTAPWNCAHLPALGAVGDETPCSAVRAWNHRMVARALFHACLPRKGSATARMLRRTLDACASVADRHYAAPIVFGAWRIEPDNVELASLPVDPHAFCVGLALQIGLVVVDGSSIDACIAPRDLGLPFSVFGGDDLALPTGPSNLNLYMDDPGGWLVDSLRSARRSRTRGSVLVLTVRHYVSRIPQKTVRLKFLTDGSSLTSVTGADGGTGSR